MDEINWAWLAGLIDGEGCLYYERTGSGERPGYSATLSISMYSWPPIEKAMTIIASLGQGSPCLCTGARNGGKTRYDLYVKGALTGAVISRVLPYLTVKAVEGQLLLDALIVCGSGRGGYSQYHLRTPEQMALQEGYHLALKEAKIQALC